MKGSEIPLYHLEIGHSYVLPGDKSVPIPVTDRWIGRTNPL